MFLQVALQKDNEHVLYANCAFSTKKIVNSHVQLAQQSELATINKLLLDVSQPLNILSVIVTYTASILTVQLCKYTQKNPSSYRKKV